MKIKNLSIKTKITIAFLAVGLTPLLISSIISYVKSSAEIHRQASEQAKLIAESQAKAISSYFKDESRSIVDLAAGRTALNALEEFSIPFTQEVQSAESAEKHRIELAKFYTEQFGAAYLEKTSRNLSVKSLLAKLDNASVSAQYDFIVANRNPLGKKDLLTEALRDSSYAQSHIRYHSFFRDYLNRHGLYDLFLVNADGRIVYSVFKETDFATHLKNGPWAESGLSKAFDGSAKLEAGKVYIEDFAAYTPSYEAPASFAGTPIYKNGKYVGSLIIQLPLDKISQIAGNRNGLGNQGETLLLGADLKLRADTSRNKITHNLAAAFAPESKISVESEAVKKAKAGGAGFMENTSYDGLRTLAYYLPVQIENLNWYVVVELSAAEVYAGLNEITLYSFIILISGTILIAFLAILFGNFISKNLKHILTVLNKSSQELSSASTQSASSATQLSEASTQQAASLQQTMASVEEISAMVSQNAESAIKTQQVVDTNQKASEQGAKSVDEMLAAIGQIKNTNDEILNQMESSNKEFGEIVKIISEIGEKTNVINDIVFQTKLLSFNASVEAARAGEHGKGFAVVAEEVGNLAAMSGKSSKEISEMLSESIKKVNDMVEHTRVRVEQLVEVGKDKIAMGQSTAAKCREALVNIQTNARTVASMTTEITNASKEQAQGINEINKAISQLDQVTQQNSSAAQQSSTQAERLNVEALSLSEVVHKLNVFVDGEKPSKNIGLNPTPQSDNDEAQPSGEIVSIFKAKKSKSV